jgi:glutamyl-tRNA reductase
LYAQLLQGDPDKKVVIDLSIPNNVHRATTEAFSMQYIEIDDLRQLAKENLAFREQEIAKAQKLLAAYIKNFPDELRQRHVELALRAIPEAVRAVKEKAINEVFKKEVAVLDAPTRELMERMMTYMEKKCVGIPMKVAKASIAGKPLKQRRLPVSFIN